jgi:cell division protein FtsZ
LFFRHWHDFREANRFAKEQNELYPARKGETRMTAKDNAIRMSFSEELSPAKIKVIGVGGGGCNAVNRMIRAKVEGVEFITANTDLQALKLSQAPVKLQLGAKLTKGLGAGANPEVGRKAALEDTDKIIEALEGSDMIFITSGLGGGTGSGAAPVVASLASELGALTVAVVTKPFAFEGKRRMLQSEQALQDLIGAVDTVIVIPNERLMETVERGTSFFDAFRIADDILRQAVQGISDIITVPGIINRDFADVKAIMSGQGYAVMGTAVATGSNRAVDAANRAIASPLLEDNSIQGAQGILINICGSPSLSLHEVHEASSIIQKAAHENANIIFGAVQDEAMKDAVKITVIAAGFKEANKKNTAQKPQFLPRTWKAGKEVPVAAAAAAGAGSSSAIVHEPQQTVVHQVQQNVREVAHEVPADDLDVPTFLRRQATQKA